MTRYWLTRAAVVAAESGRSLEQVLAGRAVDFVGALDGVEEAARERGARLWQIGMASRQMELPERGLEEFRMWLSGSEYETASADEVARAEVALWGALG